MVGAPLQTIYPQYCFELSPTISRWCHLRATDVHALAGHPGFEGQNVFFHLNHPIKWVRVAGVVVAIDEPRGRRIYTVDDSSGATIECVTNVAQLPADGNGSGPLAHKQQQQQQQQQQQKQPQPSVDYDIDVGDVVDVKGGLKLFRGVKQVVVEKAVHLRSTAQEVQFWTRLAQLRTDILSRPWVLDRKEVRRCRKQAEGVNEEKERKKRPGKNKVTGLEPTRNNTRALELRRGGEEGRKACVPPKKKTTKRITGLERIGPVVKVSNKRESDL